MTSTTNLSTEAVAEYVQFRRNVLRLTEQQNDALEQLFSTVASRTWYLGTVSELYRIAHESGRIVEGEIVTNGGDFSELNWLSEVAGSGAMDIAVAILVRDLISEDTFERCTCWWRPMREPAVLDPVEEAALGPVYAGRPGGPTPDPDRAAFLTNGSPPPRQRRPTRPRPVREDPEVLRRQLAADRHRRKVARKREAAKLTLTAVGCLLLAVLCVLMVGYTLHPDQQSVAGAMFGTWYGALVYLLISVTMVLMASVYFHKANKVRSDRDYQ